MTNLDQSNISSSSLCKRISCSVAGRPDPYFHSETEGPSRIFSDLSSSPSAEHPNVSSRCSVRLLYDIISKFNSEKVDLVKSIGFEGLIHIPLLKQINLRFSTWLMTRVDESSNSLVFPEGSCLEFNKHDVARVFGIPVGGYRIGLNSDKVQSYSSESAVSAFSQDPAHFRSIKVAHEIVTRPIDCNTENIHQDEFRAAFVVLVMSTLLAPSAKHDRVLEDYIHAIQNPSKISSYDWADYVLRRLVDAAVKLKLDIANNAKTPYIYGCPLFLEALYLDSVDLGSLSMTHDEFPRIRCFSADRFHAMIAADPAFNTYGLNMDVVCKTQLRDPKGVSYHWARSPSTQRALPAQESRLLSLWQFSLSLTRVLKIAPKGAGPLFIAALGCPDALKFLDVLLHLIEPYMNGFSYRPSISLKSRPFEFCSSRTSAGCNDPKCCSHFVTVCGKRKFSLLNAETSSSSSMMPPPPQNEHPPVKGRALCSGRGYRLFGGIGYGRYGCDGDLSFRDIVAGEVDIQAISEMARFYLQLSPVKPTRCADLNLSTQHDDPCIEVHSVGRRCANIYMRTPLHSVFSWNIDLCTGCDILKKLALVDDIDDPWFAHFCPKYIKVTTRAVKEQFAGLAELELGMVDAAIRRFKQVDDEIYAYDGNARLRHYVESDFMVSLLAGCFNITDPVQRAHFCGRHINYDVTHCRMFIFPVILQFRWACFAWRMEDNTIVVYDPCYQLVPHSDPSNCYARVAKLLRSAMALVASCFFEGWSYDWRDARLEVLDEVNYYSPSWNRSGLMCLHFCRCYDGCKTSPLVDMGKIDALSGTILAEVSGLSGNFGVVPNCIRQMLPSEIHLGS